MEEKGWRMGEEKGKGREGGRRREGAPIEMKPPNQIPKYATACVYGNWQHLHMGVCSSWACMSDVIRSV